MLNYINDYSFNITMARNGKVTEVKNLDVMFEKLYSNFDYLSEEELLSYKKQIEGIYGEKTLMENIERASFFFPDYPVAINESWEKEYNLESGLINKFIISYTLMDVNKKYYIIKGNTEILPSEDSTSINLDDASIKFDINGTMTADILVDKKTGWIHNASMFLKMDGILYFLSEEVFLQETNEIPFRMTMKLNYTD
jgi:hypothetical protein